MECVILVRMNSGKIVAIMEDGGDQIAVFQNLDEAIAIANKQPLIEAGYPYQIIECDEL